jgi:peptide/nickel transport system permease protein
MQIVANPPRDEIPAAKPEDEGLRPVGRLEQFLGPDAYRLVRGIITNPLSVAGVVLIILFALVAIFAPVLAPPVNKRDPYMVPRDGFTPEPRAPGTIWTMRPPTLPGWWKAITGTDKWTHLMGTSGGQWDIWYGVIWGTRTAFRTGMVITVLTVTIGVFIGSISAYYGGVVDTILQRITEIFMAIPFFMAALILAAVITPIVGKGELPAMIALTVFGWMGYARLIRGDILSLKERDYVLAARVIGAKDSRILMRHIIPNAVYPTLVVASLDIGTYVLSFAALSFLGIGTEIGHADWGQILSLARNYIPNLAQYWYILAFPGAAVVLFVLGWNLVGDAVRDIMDPRLRGTRG